MNRIPGTIFTFILIEALACSFFTLRSASAKARPNSGEDLRIQELKKALRREDLTKAQKTLDSLPLSLRGRSEVVFLQGLLAFKQKRHEQAEALFARVPSSHALGPSAAFNRMYALLLLNRIDRVLTVSSELARQGPAFPSHAAQGAAAAIFNAAALLLSRGKIVEARFVLLLVKKRFPKTLAGQQASRLLEKPHERSRKTADLPSCLGHYRAERYAKAAQCFEALTAAKGIDAEILFALGYARYQLGRYGKAVEAFDSVLLLNPFDGDAAFMRGMALLRLKRYRQAKTGLLLSLKLGLQNEDPREARKYLAILEKLLEKPRARSGLRFSVAAGAGYDSHPRLSGTAAEASSSKWSSQKGSGIASVNLELGYVWARPKSYKADVGYKFGQRIVFSDFSSKTSRRGGARGQDDGSALSFQSHDLAAKGFYTLGRWAFGGELSGFMELAGLDPITFMDLGASTEPAVLFSINSYLMSELSLRWTGQKAVNDQFAYLTGNGLALLLGQRFFLRKIFTARLGYGLSRWWLGTEELPVSSCTASEACALSQPYSHTGHQGALNLEWAPLRWLFLKASASIGFRRYDDPWVYRTSSGSSVSLIRKDLLQVYTAQLGFRLVRTLTLVLGYQFHHNSSSIDDKSTGIDEGYSRHVAEAMLTFSRSPF